MCRFSTKDYSFCRMFLFFQLSLAFFNSILHQLQKYKMCSCACLHCVFISHPLSPTNCAGVMYPIQESDRSCSSPRKGFFSKCSRWKRFPHYQLGEQWQCCVAFCLLFCTLSPRMCHCAGQLDPEWGCWNQLESAPSHRNQPAKSLTPAPKAHLHPVHMGV